MNINGMARGYMAKNMEAEQFLDHVVSVLERQLKEFEEAANVAIQKVQGKVILFVTFDGATYTLMLTPETIQFHQKKSPYSLDRYIWGQLDTLGLSVPAETQYLEVVTKG